MRERKRRRGFTLIELLVVIAIIGLLASVIIAALDSSRVKGRDARRLADVRQLQNALELYYLNNTNYPAVLPTLTSSNVIPVLPLDPLNGTANYTYAAIGSGASCTSYHLGAFMEIATTPALATDIDATSTAIGGTCTGSANDFNGLSAGTGTGSLRGCGTDAGTAAPAGTERCYDVKP